MWEGGPTAAQHHLDAREKHYQAGDRGDAGHDHELAEQKQQKPQILQRGLGGGSENNELAVTVIAA